MKVLEHPSAFPSILRMSTVSQSQIDLGSNYRDDRNGLRRRESFGSSTLSRRDREGSYASTVSLNRRDSYGSSMLPPNRRDSISSAISRSESMDLRNQSTKYNNQVENNRKQSFGVSLYLRPDSSGQTNLIRRDSFGSQGLRRDSTSNRNSVLRDYVSKPINDTNGHDRVDSPTLNNVLPKKETNSILRKDSVKSSNKHVSYLDLQNENSIENLAHKLTKANLNKHVTILEKNLKNNVAKKLSFDDDKLSDNSNSNSSKEANKNHTALTNGGNAASRRISIDSLEIKRNSWDRNRRGSSSSTDHDVAWKIRKEVEYNVFFTKLCLIY